MYVCACAWQRTLGITSQMPLTFFETVTFTGQEQAMKARLAGQKGTGTCRISPPQT